MNNDYPPAGDVLQIEDGRSQRSVTALFSDRSQVASDTRLVEQAVRERWNVPKRVQRACLKRLLGIVKKDVVKVVTKDGYAYVDGPADANAIAATKAIIAMTKVDQADDHKATPDQHNHKHEVEIGIDAVRQMMMSDPVYVEFLRQQAEREDAVVIEGRTVPQDHASDSLPADDD